ncbi:MAG: prepilin-type N-terminal cleavage/methylation domain-containing protein [Gemmatimonadetes bacterium]|nr:prepilin-type N-terminal cleavage/methylation domain-containing protein [Gemmatimonadota bacterium]
MRARVADRSGFTLIELMIVTLIIGILALVAAQGLGRARERSMVSTTKAELRNAMTAIEDYVTEKMQWPKSVADLEAGAYQKSPNVDYCEFRYVADRDEPYVKLKAMHRGSKTLVETRYPIWGGRMDEGKGPKGGCGGGGRKGTK